MYVRASMFLSVCVNGLGFELVGSHLFSYLTNLLKMILRQENKHIRETIIKAMKRFRSRKKKAIFIDFIPIYCVLFIYLGSCRFTLMSLFVVQ